ncbi:hypothetical protein BJ508DRAFT_379052 [Ascobolus immersus RN42]|uniref:Uncharacterized protein n=1 Tax=Ascobolus immersus RN42 TaxID=1160509 RepID=A0A3N4HV48_ASCIM|nr:hypothetical protein BJ508DRAFT_379052 [Ascobolus immersus RN42]
MDAAGFLVGMDDTFDPIRCAIDLSSRMRNASSESDTQRTNKRCSWARAKSICTVIASTSRYGLSAVFVMLPKPVTSRRVRRLYTSIESALNKSVSRKKIHGRLSGMTGMTEQHVLAHQASYFGCIFTSIKSALNKPVSIRKIHDRMTGMTE